MNISAISINRPVFITCLIILLLTVGMISLKKLPVDLFPNVTFPVVLINSEYAGASPEEVEILVSKVIEDEINNIAGLKQLTSSNTEGRSQVVAEFNSGTDIKYVEQQIREKVSEAKNKLPQDVEHITIRRIDPADKPILIVSLKAPSLTDKRGLFELADKIVKPKLEQVDQVGMIEIIGSTGRQIHVALDRNKLNARGMSATEVANKISNGGHNIPIGKIEQGQHEKIFRSFGEYKSIKDIESVVVNFFGNDIPVTVKDLGNVSDSVTDETSRSYVNGENSLLMLVYRQTGTNTIAVTQAVKKEIEKMNASYKKNHKDIELAVVRDSSKMIQDNVTDVVHSILIGIVLTIMVVYLFLGSFRSTFITGLALPTSLIGTFFLMHLAGFSINTMSLLALSLSVGLLVDDAIVVRENIFRHCELGKSPKEAAIHGSKEVLLAVIATSLTVIAVFGPIGFLDGIVGSFFKEFGLTVCFAMIISLCDALTVAPMLSAHMGLKGNQISANRLVKIFDHFQNRLEQVYERILKIVLRFPLTILLSALFIFAISLYSAKYVSKTFIPPQDMGEFLIAVEMPPGVTLQAMDLLAKKIDNKIRKNREIASSILLVGSMGEPNICQFFINMVPRKARDINTTEFKQKIREQLMSFKEAKIYVKDIDLVGGGQRPFNLNIIGGSLTDLTRESLKIFNILKHYKGIVDPEVSYKEGKPEVQIIPSLTKMQFLGVSPSMLGEELRTQMQGIQNAVYRENGQEYDIRVRLQENQRDLEKNFAQIRVPNINNQMIKLSDVANEIHSIAPAAIGHKDRQRYIQISADIAPEGPGMGGVMSYINSFFEKEYKLPQGMSYSFEGQAESFKELMQNMIIAVILGILFIYLVLASLYESFIIPLTIMLVLPLAACGAFFALLLTGHSLDIFSMIGCILLFGIATKNSILLVDYTRQLTAQGMPREQALIKACTTRLRPILMTTIALIAGMIPIAIGLNESSKQHTSMGVAVIGGLLSSTLLTLLVVPAAYSYMERFRLWFKSWRITHHPQDEAFLDASEIISQE